MNYISNSQSEKLSSTTPVRVMMVVPQYPFPVVGGLERQAHELAKSLLNKGLSVQALSGKIEEWQPDLEIVDEVKVHRISWPKKKWQRFLRAPLDILLVLFRNRTSYDVIHLHQHSWFGLFCIISAKMLRKPILTKLPNVGEFGIPGIESQRLGRIKLAILKLSDGVVAMSSESLQELAAVGYPLGRTLATPNGICIRTNLEPVSKDINSSVLCHVVFVGRLSEEKQLITLVHVWKDVLKIVDQNAVLELWGTGPQEYELKKLCEKLNLTESVIFLGHVENVRAKLLSADIFVLPSRAEGNSNAVLEAMAAGLPVVSTRIGGTPMLVGADGAAYLFDVGDKEALTNYLAELIRDPTIRLAVGAKMKKQIKSYLDITRVAQTYSNSYAKLASGRRNQIYEESNPIIIEDQPSRLDACVE